MKAFLALLCGLMALVGTGLAAALLWRGRPADALLGSVTKLIFVTTQLSALVWVFTSYAIAVYSTVRLGRVYTMAELSEPAIHTILGVGFLKVLENIFEHNNGKIFGESKEGEAEFEGRLRSWPALGPA